MKYSQPYVNSIKVDDFKPLSKASTERDSGDLLEDLLKSFCDMKQSHLYDLPNWALDQG